MPSTVLETFYFSKISSKITLRQHELERNKPSDSQMTAHKKSIVNQGKVGHRKKREGSGEREEKQD